VRWRRRSFATTIVVILLGMGAQGCGEGAREGTTAPRRFADPAQLAAEIDRAQLVIEGGSGSRSRLRRAALSEQLAFRALSEHPHLRRPTMQRLSSSARRAAMAALRAAGALSALVPAERHLPDWRIVQPPPPKRLLSYFQDAATAYKIPWQYLSAVELVETRMGRIHGLSPAGAKGPMQFMPATWAEYGRGSINDQRGSIVAAARFLRANGGPRRITSALFHYNPSRSYVVAVESYAHEMFRDPHAFYGYYYWQVLYRTTKGTFLLPVGYPRVSPRRLPN
jgi:soluble lytic murein transglycosylase-like protein